MSNKFLTLLMMAGIVVTGAAQAAEGAKHEAAPASTVNIEQKAGTCAACHGQGGVSTQPGFPTLAGQHKSYLINALKAYKSGARKNPIMAGQATGLSDAEITALADYFSRQSGPLYTPTVR